VNVLLDVLARYSINGASEFIVVNEAVSSTLIARFILDLRTVYYPKNSSEYISSLQFIGSFSGNIGAPLALTESTWVTGPADDVQEFLREGGSRRTQSEDLFSDDFNEGDRQPPI